MKLDTVTIDGAGQVKTFSCLGTASAVISFSGNFTGKIRVDGSTSENGSNGGRALFKTGVGSVGDNVIEGAGQVDREYRIVTGGERIILTVVEWSSGSCDVEFLANREASVVFVAGPVHTADEHAVRSGRGFISSSGVLPVTTGNVVVVTLQNPSDSGVNLFIERRSFTNNIAPTGTNLEFIGYANPTYVPTSSGVGVNRNAGDAASAAEFKYEVRAIAGLTIGGITGVGTVLPNGTPYDLDFIFILEPGKGLGILVEGEGNNIGNAARISLGFMWHEEIVN